MNTDKIPRKKSLKAEYLKSDELSDLPLPPSQKLQQQSRLLEQALALEDRAAVKAAANAISEELCSFYEVETAPVKVLGVRPRRVSESSIYELFGDYDTQTMQIRLWMRTAVLKKATAFGTLLATLCHELCHHLDLVYLDLPNTYHTRGFFRRAGLLYHHIRNTRRKELVFKALSDGSFSIDWPATMGRTKAND